MKNSILTKVLFFLFLTGGFAQDRPNIIFILVDDQRYDFLSYLDHPWIKTPNIDSLAKNSVYFKNAFVTSSLCSPSRASIVTGQYPHQHGVIDNDTPLNTNTPNFPRELQKNGYNTGFVGKWHMGGNNDMPRPGFEYWLSFEGQGQYFDPSLNLNGERIERSGYMTEILTEYAVDFIKSNTNGNRPYFLYLSHKAVHEPFEASEKHSGYYRGLDIPKPKSFADSEVNNAGKPKWVKRQRKSWHGAERNFSKENYEGSYDRYFQKYSECMLGVDESVGIIRKELKKLGQLENTVIIYFSDNGYMIGEHGLIDKRVMYEESIRVPAFVHWPDMFKKPITLPDFVLNIDIGPTILDIAGIKKPWTMQGESFLPLTLGSEVDWREDFLYEYFIDSKAVQTPTIFGLRTRDYSYMTYSGVWDISELYDMNADPNQMNNLLGKVDFGQEYGSFLKNAQEQVPEMRNVLEGLDKRLTELLSSFDGNKKPSWDK